MNDIEALLVLRRTSILAIPAGAYYSPGMLQNWALLRRSKSLENRILDGCVLVADHDGVLLASNSLDLDRREMVALFVSPSAQRQGLGQKMVSEVEKLAIHYGLLQLQISAAQPSINFYQACGYKTVKDATIKPDLRTKLPALHMYRHFPHRQTRYGRKTAVLHQQLGIADDYGLTHRLTLQHECRNATSIGQDIFAREQMMIPRAARAWSAMKQVAASAGIELQAVSAFRSVDYQCGIISRKLNAGHSIEDIIKVSAAPGYSEHHSGRALDITTPGFKPLQETFEKSPAFTWLQNSADKHGFRMSYPKVNRHGMAYEPWHWYWTG